MSAPGEYIGRYRIVRPLGEGGMGRVLLAEVEGAGGFARRVVLKLVRDELDESLKQALVEEARVTATLVHRNIVPVLDLQESGAQRLVVLEHIDGMDVQQLLRRTPLVDWPLAAFIAGEVAAALDYAHRRQIIHRDVSPANILLSFEGEVKLSDFGVAKVVGEAGGRVVGPTQGLKGKLGYMAPEQMKRQPVDPRADVYALGVVLYEMLTGKNPMRAGPIVPPPLPATVPPELAAIVLRAVERNREDRFASAADMREAIVHIAGQPADPARLLADFLGEMQRQQARGLDDALVEAVLGGKAATRMANKPSGRARWPWLAAAGALLVALVGIGAAALHHRHARMVTPPAPKSPAVVEKTAPPPPEPQQQAETVPTPAPPPPSPPETIELPPTRLHRHLPRGTISVNAIPWANVFIDGHAAGHTPRRKLALEPGRHQLRLVTQAGETRSRTVEITPNHETTLTVVFSEP
ncbi:MAG TPA: serine/threonine-protein kinase [Polyangia bacterium]|nr:serine/threonine-protein kinase [Polyangia bacterium]